MRAPITYRERIGHGRANSPAVASVGVFTGVPAVCFAVSESDVDAGLSVVVVRVFRRASSSPTISLSSLAISEYHSSQDFASVSLATSRPRRLGSLAKFPTNRGRGRGCSRAPLSYSRCHQKGSPQSHATVALLQSRIVQRVPWAEVGRRQSVLREGDPAATTAGKGGR